jgi:hypothetical protein
MVALDELTAAEWNLEVRDAVNFLLNPPQASANHTAGTSLTTSTWTLVSLGAEQFDTDVMHDIVTNNSRMIAKTAGKYLITAKTTYAINATGIRRISVEKNGAGVQGAGTQIEINSKNALAGMTAPVMVTTQVVMAANDYLEVFAWQSSGGNLALSTGDRNTYLEMLWVGV